MTTHDQQRAERIETAARALVRATGDYDPDDEVLVIDGAGDRVVLAWQMRTAEAEAVLSVDEHVIESVARNIHARVWVPDEAKDDDEVMEIIREELSCLMI